MTLKDKNGFIIRPKLREAYDRILRAHGADARMTASDGTRSAEAFLRFIENTATRRGMTPDEAAAYWGY